MQPTQVEQKLIQFAFPRMGWQLWTAAGIAVFLFFFTDRAASVGSLLISVLNACAFAFIGYHIHNQLERGKRPHQIWEEARIAHVEGQAERGWQLEQLADSAQKRRTTVVSACILASVLMKF